MDVSICIVSYNTRDVLRESLLSVIANPPQGEYEIIVVDNGSGDGSPEMLNQEFPQVHTILNSENLGYTVPMNQALRKAAGRYLVQLNPDTVILNDAFQALQNFMDRCPEVGICTPKVLNRDGTLQKQCRRSAARPWDAFTYFTQLASLFPKSKTFSGYLMTYRDENESHPVEAVSGSCMFIRREVINQIGYLDENFFAYQEDSDFCFRARRAGWEIYYLPQAKIIHYGGEGGTKAHLYQSILTWHKSYYRYYHKHLARDYFFLFNWFFYGLMSLKLGFSLLRGAISKEKFVGSKKP